MAIYETPVQLHPDLSYRDLVAFINENFRNLYANANSWQDFEPTATGWSSTSIRTARYTQIGKTVIMSYNVAGISNDKIAEITLPIEAVEITNIFFGSMFIERAEDNGGDAQVRQRIRTDVSPDKITFYNYADPNGFFTNSGTKSVRGTIVYESK